jgi:hypothetical protein
VVEPVGTGLSAAATPDATAGTTVTLNSTVTAAADTATTRRPRRVSRSRDAGGDAEAGQTSTGERTEGGS